MKVQFKNQSLKLEKFAKQVLNNKQLVKTEGGPVTSRGTVTTVQA